MAINCELSTLRSHNFFFRTVFRRWLCVVGGASLISQYQERQHRQVVEIVPIIQNIMTAVFRYTRSRNSDWATGWEAEGLSFDSR